MNQETNVRICPNCNEQLDRIWFTAQMTEEWSWNGQNWESPAIHSLTTDPEQPVLCSNCEVVIGTGIDFGFGIVLG